MFHKWLNDRCVKLNDKEKTPASNHHGEYLFALVWNSIKRIERMKLLL